MKARLVSGAVLATVAVLAAAWRGALAATAAAAVDSVVIASLLLVALVARLRPREEVASAFETATRRSAPGATLPSDFSRAQRLVGGALGGDELLRDRLGPYLHSIVAQRLATRHGIDMARSPRAQELVSPDLWELIATVRSPTAADARRLSTGRLECLLEEVEGI